MSRVIVKYDPSPSFCSLPKLNLSYLFKSGNKISEKQDKKVIREYIFIEKTYIDDWY